MDVADLYGLPLERFVPARDALAKELRRNGDGVQAETVAKLRKPSLAAWAVNQLIRTQTKQVKELFAAGDAAQRAQARLLEGKGDGAALRKALGQEREAVSDLVERAGGLLSGEGHELSPTMLERVSQTLHAAALEAESREDVSRGCLDRELRHVGLNGGGLTGAAGAPAPASTRSRATGRTKERETRQDTERKAQNLSGLRKAEASARREAERAARDLAGAQSRREKAAAALSQAEAELADARRRVKETEAAVRRASRDLEKARRTR